MVSVIVGIADNLNDFKAKQYVIVISLFSSVKNKKQKTFELSYQKVTLSPTGPRNSVVKNS